MPCIKIQKLVFNDDGSIHSGSASILVSSYDKSIKGHSRKTVREKLGKILSINEEHSCGIFLSPTRRLVEYDAKKDEFASVDSGDPRLPGWGVFPDPPVHTIFGDAYLVLGFAEKCGMVSVLRDAFTNAVDYEKVLCHLLHTICRDGAKISCDDFFTRSVASCILRDIPVGNLGADTPYFTAMGEDRTKLAFFHSFIKYMRRRFPNFGTGCYVDLISLPNDITDNPLNALCSHGVASASVQTRLVLVLDEETGLPVWFQTIPGNVLDLSTISGVMEDVAESLGIQIGSLVLDAGYVTKSIIGEFSTTSCPADGADGDKKTRTIVATMPAKKGYPHRKLYNETRHLYPNAKYEFIRKLHTYFGTMREIALFGFRMYVYIYVDKDNALTLGRKEREKHEDAYQRLTMAEKLALCKIRVLRASVEHQGRAAADAGRVFRQDEHRGSIQNRERFPQPASTFQMEQADSARQTSFRHHMHHSISRTAENTQRKGNIYTETSRDNIIINVPKKGRWHNLR